MMQTYIQTSTLHLSVGHGFTSNAIMLARLPACPQQYTAVRGLAAYRHKSASKIIKEQNNRLTQLPGQAERRGSLALCPGWLLQEVCLVSLANSPLSAHIHGTPLHNSENIINQSLQPISWEPGQLVGQSAGFMIERLRVQIPAGVAGEFSSPESTLCADSCLASITPPALLQWHVKDPGHSAKSAGGRLYLNAHTPLTQRSWTSGLTILLYRHRVGAYHETSSHATCQGTLGHRHLSLLSHCGLFLA